MPTSPIISIDIGSTWTKGALFGWNCQGGLELLGRRQHPTTQDDLAGGFSQVQADLQALLPAGMPARTRFCSSAKGGLGIVAVGLVPELTLEAARLAALSAGGKVLRAFAYKLTAADLREMERLHPDIILLAGGTDGGNEEYVRHNLQALTALAVPAAIVYAGNRAMADAARTMLAGHDLHAVDNLFPEFNQLHPEPARAAIRDIFLKQIVKGRGLDRIVAATGGQPLPTPLAFFKLVEAIAEHCPGWQEFCALDMGGATTDVYSCHDESLEEDQVLHRGLPEPRVKRTVEGDLGVRISARTAAEAAPALIRERLAGQGLAATAWQAFLDRIAVQPDWLPESPAEQACDRILANACVVEALFRHCGRDRTIFTVDGDRTVRHGRNLSRIAKVVGSGGFLSQLAASGVLDGVGAARVDAQGGRVLWPREFEYWIDAQYLWPLLGNLAGEYPDAAAALAVASLKKVCP